MSRRGRDEKASASGSGASADPPPTKKAKPNPQPTQPTASASTDVKSIPTFTTAAGKVATADTTQLDALAAAKAGVSVALVGKAGTGKSEVATEAIRYMREEMKKNVCITAATAFAANQIGGQTLHSFFGLGIVDKPMEHYIKQAQEDLAEFYEIRAELQTAQTEARELQAAYNKQEAAAKRKAAAEAAVDAKTPKKVDKLTYQFATKSPTKPAPTAAVPAKNPVYGEGMLTEAQMQELIRFNLPHRVALRQVEAIFTRMRMTRAYAIRQMDVWVNDETFLLTPHTLQLAVGVLDVLREGRPPLQTIMMGDATQRLCINPKPKPEDDIHKHGYYGMNKAMLMDTMGWAALKLKVFRFQRVFRQSDPKFVGALELLRLGIMTNGSEQYLSTMSVAAEFVNKGYVKAPVSADGTPAVYITGTKGMADQLNLAELMKVSGPMLQHDVEMYYVFRNPFTNNVYYRCILEGDNSKGLNFDFVRDVPGAHEAHKRTLTSAAVADATAAASAPAAADPDKEVDGQLRTVAMDSGFRSMVEYAVYRNLREAVVQPTSRFKVNAPIMFTRSAIPENIPPRAPDPPLPKIYNGLQGMIVASNLDNKCRLEPQFSQVRPSDFIRMKCGSIPAAVRQLTIRVHDEEGRPYDLKIPQNEEWIPVEPGDANRKQELWSRFLVKRYFPAVTCFAVTCDKIQGCQFKSIVVDMPSIESRQSPGLFYTAISRAREADKVMILGAVNQAALADPRNIYAERNVPGVIRNLPQDYFKLMMSRGIHVNRYGEEVFSYRPDAYPDVEVFRKAVPLYDLMKEAPPAKKPAATASASASASHP